MLFLDLSLKTARQATPFYLIAVKRILLATHRDNQDSSKHRMQTYAKNAFL